MIDKKKSKLIQTNKQTTTHNSNTNPPNQSNVVLSEYAIFYQLLKLLVFVYLQNPIWTNQIHTLDTPLFQFYKHPMELSIVGIVW